MQRMFKNSVMQPPPAPTLVAAGQQVAPEAPPTAAERADYTLAGVIGAQLSSHVSLMQQIIQEFNATRKISRSQMQTLYGAIESTAAVSRQAQQIARLGEGRIRQSHERLKLHDIVNLALDERALHLQQAGTEVYRNVKPVEIIVDPGLLSTLVDTALDWAAEFGQRLTVSLTIKNWPEYGVLQIKASQSISESEFEPETVRGDNLQWHLLTQLAKAMGVTLERDMSGGQARLICEFARTVKQMEGLTTVELDTGGDSSYATKPLAGHRILLVTTDAMIRAEVKNSCDLLGLRADTVPNSERAVRYVETDMPHLIIIDERLRDDTFDNLIDDMRRLDPNFGCLEVAEGNNTFEMSSWMSDSITRVSRDVLRDQLTSALTLELAKAL